MTALELGPAVVLATLLWCAGRVVAALIEGRTYGRRDSHLQQLLHHVDRVAVVVGDVFTALEDIGKDVAAVRDALEQHDP